MAVTDAPGDEQTFTYSHESTTSFKTGLRPYASYRDLGMAKGTNGRATAHVIRFHPPCTDDVRIWHTHDIEFQMVYVLKGWVVAEMEGHAPEKMTVGSAWMQPPNIRHRLVDYSDDCELLEVVLPADFDTELA
ncbi:cupin domain-containing protein [Acuticoccus sp. I52.16.1]|uniref:cupin domain-containing protein n=1 Tax=Acuticoccus sp. I52.16.1 TaxID=2928472 RepID=UPI00352ED287